MKSLIVLAAALVYRIALCAIVLMLAIPVMTFARYSRGTTTVPVGEKTFHLCSGKGGCLCGGRGLGSESGVSAALPRADIAPSIRQPSPSSPSKAA